MSIETRERIPNWRSETWHPPAVDSPESIPKGDMPGDRIFVNPECIAKSCALFPRLMSLLVPRVNARNPPRAVISVYGGSGAGKSAVGSLLAYYLNDIGFGALTLSGDNYPRRIPRENDRERLRTFRECGIRGLAACGEYSRDRHEIIQGLQDRDLDSNPDLCRDHPWLAAYQGAGRAGLEVYLGTPKEIDFEEVNGIVERFKSGASSLILKRMGREERDLWYESVDVADARVLVLEWTHGNSDWLRGIDIPIFLNSTPGETLEYRRSRARDSGCDNPFTAMVLDIEQRMLDRQADRASLIVARNGGVISLEAFRALAGTE